MKKLRPAGRKGAGGKSKTKGVSVKDDKSVAEKSESENKIEELKVETVVKKNIAEEKVNEENMKTPMKRKRGADSEIVRAFISSPEKGSSRLRPRKEVPAFRMIELSESDTEKIIGKRVKVYWSGSRKWFLGRIKAFDVKKGLHKIYYEDGDKEELDLRQERFELEVMPSDNLTLKTKSISEKKLKGSDGGRNIVERLKEESLKGGNPELVKKHSELEKKRAPKETLNSGRSKSKRREDAEDKKAEDMITEMEVDVLPKRVGKVKTDEVQDVEKLNDTGAGKDCDGSKSISEKSLKTNGPSDAQPLGLEFISKSNEKDSDDSEESRKTVKDNSVRGGDAEPGKRHVKPKKKTTPRAAKVRSSRLQSRKESKEKEKQAADMEVGVPQDEIKTETMPVEINVKESLELDYLKENAQGKSPAKEASLRNGGTSGDAQASQQIFISENKELDLKDGEVCGEAGDVGCSSPQGVKVNVDDLALEREVSVNPEDVEEKVISGDIKVEVRRDVNILKNNDEMKSFSKVVNEGTSEVSPDLQPTVSPKHLEEEDPEILHGKLKSEDSASAGEISKEELKKDNISEGMRKTSTQHMEQPDDNQRGNCIALVDIV